jgi:hypothetical protein
MNLAAAYGEEVAMATLSQIAANASTGRSHVEHPPRRRTTSRGTRDDQFCFRAKLWRLDDAADVKAWLQTGQSAFPTTDDVP